MVRGGNSRNDDGRLDGLTKDDEEDGDREEILNHGGRGAPEGRTTRQGTREEGDGRLGGQGKEEGAYHERMFKVMMKERKSEIEIR